MPRKETIALFIDSEEVRKPIIPKKPDEPMVQWVTDYMRDRLPKAGLIDKIVQLITSGDDKHMQAKEGVLASVMRETNRVGTYVGTNKRARLPGDEMRKTGLGLCTGEASSCIAVSVSNDEVGAAAAHNNTIGTPLLRREVSKAIGDIKGARKTGLVPSLPSLDALVQHLTDDDVAQTARKTAHQAFDEYDGLPGDKKGKGVTLTLNGLSFPKGLTGKKLYDPHRTAVEAVKEVAQKRAKGPFNLLSRTGERGSWVIGSPLHNNGKPTFLKRGKTE